MTNELLKGFKKWFNTFVQDYNLENPQDQENIDLKIAHTYRVVEAIRNIGSELHLTENEMLLAQTMALFHDVGRFPQYKKYKTFKDNSSENHATLSVTKLKKDKVLEPLSHKEQHLIYCAIAHHNKAQIPDNIQDKERFYAQLLRDADKVDILYTLTHYYEKEHKVQNKTLSLDLKEGNDISNHILDCFLNGKIIMVEDMKEVNDFKILQLAWINDLNFYPSLQLIIKAGSFDKIIATLPQGEKRKKVSAYLNHIIDKRMSAGK